MLKAPLQAGSQAGLQAGSQADPIIEKVSAILSELNEEMLHRKKILSRYKLTHCLLQKSQLVLNSASIACGSSAAVSISTGLGIVPGVALSVTTASTAGLAVLLSIIDQKILSKIHTHYQLLILARTLDLKLFQKYLYDAEISVGDFNAIIDMISTYHKERDVVITKSLFVSNNINELDQEFKKRLNGSAVH